MAVLGFRLSGSWDPFTMTLIVIHLNWNCVEVGGRAVSDHDVPLSLCVLSMPFAGYGAAGNGYEEIYMDSLVFLDLPFIFSVVRDCVTSCILYYTCGSSLLVARRLVSPV